MPNTSWTAALNEARALAPNDDLVLETIQLKHAGATDKFLVRDRASWNLTLEDSSVQTFVPTPFRLTLPTSNFDGVQEMRLAIDNIEPDVPDFVAEVGASTTPIQVIYRPYLKSDPTTVQMDPPLTLTLHELETNQFEVLATARFSDVVNARYLTENYTRARFPGLGG